MTSITYNPILSSIKHTLSDILIFFITFFHLMLPAQPENLEITLNPVTTESTSISFEIKNKTNRPVGRPTFYFEKNVDGKWEKAGFKYAIPEYGYTLTPTATETEGVYIENPESVTAGEYRLNVFYRVGTGITSSSEHQKTVLFTIS